MAVPRWRLLELYGDDVVDEPFPEQPVTPAGKLRAAAIERASWCLATGQPWDAWLVLSLRDREAFLEAVIARANAVRGS